eukprot:5642167-Alexandrium_andersonii.AAC.1
MQSPCTRTRMMVAFTSLATTRTLGARASPFCPRLSRAPPGVIGDPRVAGGSSVPRSTVVASSARGHT